MIPEAREVHLSRKDRKVLEACSRSPTTLQRDLKRARIVLLAAAGRSTRSIAKEVGVQPRITVADSKFEFPGTISRSTVKEALVTFFKQEKAKGQGSKLPPQMDPEQDATEISQKFTSRDFPEFALQTSALLVSVPAILFVLGALLLWIGAGFRRRPVHEN
jgi:hypothetical protein